MSLLRDLQREWSPVPRDSGPRLVISQMLPRPESGYLDCQTGGETGTGRPAEMGRERVVPLLLHCASHCQLPYKSSVNMLVGAALVGVSVPVGLSVALPL